jgi:hypothetical protein
MDAGVEEESGPDESSQRPQPDVRVRGSRQPRRIEREQMPRRFTPEVEVHEPRGRSLSKVARSTGSWAVRSARNVATHGSQGLMPQRFGVQPMPETSGL